MQLKLHLNGKMSTVSPIVALRRTILDRDFEEFLNLIDLCVDCINEKNEFGESPLLLAVMSRAPSPFVSVLLRYGADIDTSDKHGRTINSFVMSNQMREVFDEYLLKHK
jgi:ankyrin repeat protein